MFSILTRCEMMVCNDSGMAHLAARATRTLALFGPTDPGEWAPVGKNVLTIQAPANELRALSPQAGFGFIVLKYEIRAE